MAKFPVDAPKNRVIKAFGLLGFRVVREREYIAMTRNNPDGTQTPLTMPNHARLKGSTLRTICGQANVPRDEFLKAYEQKLSLPVKSSRYARLFAINADHLLTNVLPVLRGAQNHGILFPVCVPALAHQR